MLLSAFDRRDFKDRVALIFLGKRWTFGEIAMEAGHIAAGLQALGVRKGDRVALHFKNSPELLASLVACWWIGAVAVPIRPWQAPAMTVSWCNHLDVVCLLIEDLLLDKVAPHVAELTSCVTIVSTAVAPLLKGVQSWSALAGNDGDYRRLAVEEHEPVIVLHTSGTTARPKAVAQSRHALEARARGQLKHLPLGPEDVVCVFSDCSHGFGLHTLMMPSLAVGATVLLIPEFDPAAIIHEMATYGATFTGSAPGYLVSLLEAARRQGRPIGSKLRFAICSSDKAPPDLPRGWQEVFGTPLLEAYGLTEACSLIFSNRLGDVRAGTIGRPMSGVHVRIVDPDGRDVPDGTVGELWCSGDFLFAGYWNDADATRRAVLDGWLRTGDQAVRDQDGRYRIVGRTGFMIKRGGIFVSPFEVEAALADHPAVAECLAAGMPSELWGQEVEAFIVLKYPIPLGDLRAYAASALGEPSRPVRFWSVERIPKTNLGKMARGEIEKLRYSARLLTE